MQSCFEQDLRHFHKARLRMAQLYRQKGELGKAREVLEFGFKWVGKGSGFSINLWEIGARGGRWEKV